MKRFLLGGIIGSVIFGILLVIGMGVEKTLSERKKTEETEKEKKTLAIWVLIGLLSWVCGLIVEPYIF